MPRKSPSGARPPHRVAVVQHPPVLLDRKATIARMVELLGEAVTAMESEATVETLMHTIHAHPTLYEAMGEAFNNVYGLAINA